MSTAYLKSVKSVYQNFIKELREWKLGESNESKPR